MTIEEFYDSSRIKWVADIIYKGKGVSFNKIYAQGTWYIRNNIKNRFGKIFKELVAENEDIRWMNQYVIDVSYNSRHDPDNIIAMEKIFIDVIKQEIKNGVVINEGFIRDDSKKYCRGVILRPDETLKYNNFKFTLYEYDDTE